MKDHSENDTNIVQRQETLRAADNNIEGTETVPEVQQSVIQTEHTGTTTGAQNEETQHSDDKVERQSGTEQGTVVRLKTGQVLKYRDRGEMALKTPLEACGPPVQRLVHLQVAQQQVNATQAKPAVPISVIKEAQRLASTVVADDNHKRVDYPFQPEHYRIVICDLLIRLSS
ncbi:hypothetical protein SRHO_G00317420 [Serrasalmus rhombeus]